MTEEANIDSGFPLTPQIPAVKKIKKGCIHKILKILKFTFIFLFVFLIVLFFFIQTSFFKNWLLHYGIEILNEKLASKETVISIESIEGNIVKNIKLNKISVRVQNDTLLKLKQLDIDYDLLRLVRKEIVENKVILNSPEVNIVKVKDKNGDYVWNIDYLLKPEKEKEIDTSKKEFDWDIYAKGVWIVNGSARILGEKPYDVSARTIKMKYLDKLDFSNLDINDLNLELSGNYTKKEKSISVKQFALKTNSAFNLNKFNFGGSLSSDDLAEIHNLELNTDRSFVNIKSAVFENFNPFKEKISYEGFKEKNISLELLLNKFNNDDLNFFLPDLKFLRGDVYLDIKAKGKYGDFTLDRLIVRTGSSDINLKGRVQNLHNPSKLYFNVKLNNSVIDPSETKTRLPGLAIPDYSHLGKINADITFKGEPLKFETEFDVRTSAGNAKGKGTMDITQKDIYYKGDIEASGVNVGRILNDDKIKLVLTGHINAEGNGFDYRKMRAKINYDITNSTVYNQSIAKSSGTIDANAGKIDLNINYASNSVITAVQGNVDISDITKPIYDLKGTVGNLDLSTFSGGKDKSNLNFKFDVKGSGLNPDDLTGNFSINMSPSYFGGIIIPSTPLTAKIDKIENGKRVSVNSRLFDFNAEGKLSFTILPLLFTDNLQVLINDFKRRFEADSSFRSYSTTDYVKVENEKISTVSTGDNQSVNFSYSLAIKDINVLNLITSDSSLRLKADLTGVLKGTSNRMKFTAKGNISDFSYKDTSLLFSKGFLDFEFANRVLDTINGFRTKFNFYAVNGNSNGMRFDSAIVNLNSANNKTVLSFDIKKDTSMFAFASGNVKLGNNSVYLNFDTLNIKAKNYRINNNEPVLINYTASDSQGFSGVINAEKIKLGYERQSLELKGYYSLKGNSDLTLAADRIKISELQKVLNPNIPEEDLIKGNLRRFKAKFMGTTDNPNINIEANSDVLSMEKFKLGRLDAILNYSENVVSPDISIYNPNNEGRLLVGGFIPVQNPLESNIDKDKQKDFLDNDVKINVDAANFQIKIFEQFIPVISGLKGNMNGKIDIQGIVKKPLLTGKLDVLGGSFVLDMTGMKYNFNAALATQEQKLLIQRLDVFRPRFDGGIFNANGYIDFSNLKLSELLLTMNGEFKVFDNEVTSNIMGIYGDLYGKTGSQGLILKGGPDGMDLNGNILLTKGRTSIIPNKKEAYNLYADNIRYTVEFDSLSYKKDSIDFFVNKMRDSLTTMNRKRLDPFQFFFLKNITTLVPAGRSKNNFRYNIAVKTQDKLYTSILIDETTKQEFTGNVSANLTFDNLLNDSLNIRGRINLEDNCYYRFYKKFKAAGSILSNGSILNADLFIIGEFDGFTSSPNNPGVKRQVAIMLVVTGQTMKPILNWQVTVDGSPVGGNDPTDDAVSFLIFGKFKDELNADQRLNLVSNLGANVGSAYASQFVSGFIQNILPFIVNTDINYVNTESGSLAENTDIRFTAEVGDAIIRFGGQLFKDLSNTNVTVEYPLNKLLRMKSLSNNLIFQFERLVDPYSQNKTFSTANRVGAMVFYRVKF
ncbi:hypothetical protein D4R20_01370 [bacterium]|nr:MAG: hypothetical protein D4R20_01370 [bacterium]